MAAACRLLRGDAVLELIAMFSGTESLAFHLVRALFNSTGGLPHEWRMLEELDGATTDAVEFAAARGWVAI